MRDFENKTAFVTGGASGIGLALGRAFAEAGMKVMLADVETAALEKALPQLLERALATGQRAVVLAASEDRIEALSNAI